ncbi:MAG TPA: oxidoreductase [Acidimicrobiales bacterium]|nr:oxidoreductase [Acidimicrobiales bacterium]
MPQSRALETLTLADDLTITRMGYGAMQLAGPRVFGEPRDRPEALAVLREVAASGITHVDTADYYGPVITNQLIREALHPYDGITVATKVGWRRRDDGPPIQSLAPADLQAQVHDNLNHLGVDALDLVNLRLASAEGAIPDSIEAGFSALAELQQKGLIRHLGVSNVSSDQVTQAQRIAPVVTIQNLYNLANRRDDDLVVRAATEHIAFVPFFPLGGFSPLQSDILSSVAGRLGASPQQVALAWLLQRSTTMSVIPGTSSRAHLRENIAAVDLALPADAIEDLDAIGTDG